MPEAPQGHADVIRLRAVTYNVHGWLGPARRPLVRAASRRDPAPALEMLARLAPDIAALQEVACRGSAPSPRQIAERLGMQPVSGFTLRRDLCDFGNLLLTRLPVLETRVHDLSLPGREPRGAVEAVLDVGEDAGSRPLRVLATHLGLRGAERAEQARRLAELAAGAEDQTPLPCLLLGDCNEWSPRSSRLAPLRERLTGRTARSFPAGWPVLALDQVWTSPEVRVARITAPRGRAARAASDHLPVLAELELDPA